MIFFYLSLSLSLPVSRMASLAEDNSKNECEEVSFIRQTIRQMLVPDFVFPQQDTDDNMKLNITGKVSFGDLVNASKENPQNKEVYGTIIGYICTVRKFHPGNYKVTVIKPFSDTQKYVEYDPLVIFHHTDINPNLLAQQVLRMTDDYCNFHRDLRNSINRYDWCHFNNWGYCDSDDIISSFSEQENVDNDDSISSFSEQEDEDKNWRRCKVASKVMKSFLQQDFESVTSSVGPLPKGRSCSSLIYFTKTEEAKNLVKYIQKKQIRRSSAVRYLFAVENDDGCPISLGMDFAQYSSLDWNFGKVFEDPESSCYYALILNGYNTLEEEPRPKVFSHEEKLEMGFTTVKKTELKFPMNQFIRQ